MGSPFMVALCHFGGNLMVKNFNEILYQNETMKTERLILRRFRPEDAADMLEYASCPETVKTLEWDGAQTLEEVKAAIFNFSLSRPGIWAIEIEENGKMIGAIDIRLKHAHDKASFGYVINSKFWGRGYMTEALEEVMKLCFTKLNLNRMEASHYCDNPASGRVMEKVGMFKEGQGKQNEIVKGVFKNLVFYGLCRSDYDEKLRNK